MDIQLALSDQHRMAPTAKGIFNTFGMAQGWDRDGQGAEIVTLVDSGRKRQKKIFHLLESAKFGFAYWQ